MRLRLVVPGSNWQHTTTFNFVQKFRKLHLFLVRGLVLPAASGRSVPWFRAFKLCRQASGHRVVGTAENLLALQES